MRNDEEKSESNILLHDVDMQETHRYYDESPTSSTRAHPPEDWPVREEGIARYREMVWKVRVGKWLEWMRWSVVIMLQGAIIVLLVWRRANGWRPEDTETGGDINGLYIPHSHQYTLLQHEPSKYMPNMTSNVDRLEVRENWSKLLPLGSGTVRIPNWEKYPMLGTPITDDPIRSGPIFETAWTHALHCLYYTLDTYHQLVLSHGTKFGLKGLRNDWHAAHCFEYLRLQIMCMADMTLEGSHSVLDTKGEGTAHVCRDRKEVWDWLEERRVDDLRSIVVGLVD